MDATGLAAGTFVIPPSGFLLDERVFPSLGVLKVAASLETGGVECDVLDLSGVGNIVEAVRKHVLAKPRAWYGVTATTPQLPGAVIVAETIRATIPGAKLVLGGPHVTLLNAARKKHALGGRIEADFQSLLSRFDVIVAGDGELAIWKAILPGVTGIIDADTPASPFFLSNKTLGEVALPARHKVDLLSYHYEVDGHRATSLIAQLGCPFGCAYCGGRNSPAFRRVRIRPQDRVVDELRALYMDFGFTGFMFQDDELNVNPGLMELLDKIRLLQEELGVEFRFRGFLKSQLVTEEQAAALYAAGFRHVLVGFEAADDRILLNIQKQATLAQNTRCMEICRKAGLKVKALMSIGHAGDTKETILAVRDWLLAVRPHDFDVTVITVYPGTPYFDDAKANGDHWTFRSPRNGDALHFRALDFLSEIPYYKGVPGQYQAFVWTETLTSEELVRLRDQVEDEVRKALGIPYPKAWAETHVESSMGQTNAERVALNK